jgi:hypothetical protein
MEVSNQLHYPNMPTWRVMQYAGMKLGFWKLKVAPGRGNTRNLPTTLDTSPICSPPISNEVKSTNSNRDQYDVIDSS